MEGLSMLLWKTLHILSMVMMVTVFIGVEIFYAAAMWRRDVDKLAWVHRITERGVGFLALIGLIAGVIFGVLAALEGGFDLTAPWLVAAYLLIGIFLVNAAIIGRNVFYMGREAVKVEEGERPAEEVVREMVANRGVILVLVNAVLFALIIIDMTIKPF